LKRYLLLGALTCLALWGTLFLGEYVIGSRAKVELTTMTTALYAETVSAKGEVTEAVKREMTADLPLVIDEVRCAPGDRVKAGNVLFTVDRKATEEYLFSLVSETLDVGGEEIILSFLQLLGKNAEEELSQLLPAVITAPENGIVSRLNVKGNTAVLPGEVLAVVAESDERRVVLSVSEEEAARVKEGQTVTMKGVASAGFTGKVLSVSDTAKKKLSGTAFETVVEVTVAPDKALSLKPGSSVSAEIELETPRQLNLLPYEAVGQDEQGREYVYLYSTSQGNVQKRPVVSGAEVPKGVEIVEGIYPSDLIVSDASTVSGEGGAVQVLGRVKE